MEGSVVILDISKILPVFGIIINILLNHILFVNYYIPRNFYCYIVKRDKPIPITFCMPNELSDYYTLGLAIYFTIFSRYSSKSFILCHSITHDCIICQTHHIQIKTRKYVYTTRMGINSGRQLDTWYSSSTSSIVYICQLQWNCIVKNLEIFKVLNFKRKNINSSCMAGIEPGTQLCQADQCSTYNVTVS